MLVESNISFDGEQKQQAGRHTQSQPQQIQCGERSIASKGAKCHFELVNNHG